MDLHWLDHGRIADPQLEVIQHIHERDEGIIRAIIRVEVLMDVSISEPFSAHVVEMVACLKLAPVIYELLVSSCHNLLLKLEHLYQCRLLHLVACPS